MSGGEASRSENVVARTLRFIRFSHTVFALPFAVASMLVAARGLPAPRLVVLILMAMVAARTAAMAFNRIVDWNIDQRNPRTAARHRLLSRAAAIVLLVVSSVVFVAVTAFINPLCFSLSPVALGIVFFYSVTKRFTSSSHFFLGLALSVSPVGAWLAVRGAFAFPPLVLALAVLLWVAGFDIIYATLDREFDVAEGLRSMVVLLGLERSLRLAETLHWMMLAILVFFGVVAQLGPIYFSSLVLVGGAIVFEHRSAKQLDPVAVNQAFFSSNAFVSLVLVLAIAADIGVRGVGG